MSCVVEFPVDGDPYCTLAKYWAFVEVSHFFTQELRMCPSFHTSSSTEAQKDYCYTRYENIEKSVIH